jgi:hypothetical protein
MGILADNKVRQETFTTLGLRANYVTTNTANKARDLMTIN